MIPLYPFRCPQCGRERETYGPITLGSTAPLCDCGTEMLRRYEAPAVVRGMQPHYNHSLGRRISSRREWNDALRAASDEQSARTGIEANYVEVDPTDRKGNGVTDEGLEAQQKVVTDKGHPDLGKRESRFYSP